MMLQRYYKNKTGLSGPVSLLAPQQLRSTELSDQDRCWIIASQCLVLYM
jgi:hypothetical protein